MSRDENINPGDARVDLDPSTVTQRDSGRQATPGERIPTNPDTADVSDMAQMADANVTPTRPIATDGGMSDEVKSSDSSRAGSLKDQLMGKLSRSASDGASDAADVAAGAAGAAAQGVRNLPKNAARMLGRTFGPVGVMFSRAGGAVASVLHVSQTVGNAAVVVALLAALGGGTVLATGGNGFSQALFTDYDECMWIEAAEAQSRYGTAENTIPEPYGDQYTVCEPYDSYDYPYDQGKVQDIWRQKGSELTDESPSIDGRYLVATTLKYGSVGDQVDFYLDDGTLIPCIISDIKNENDAGCNEWGHNDGHCVLEFQWHHGVGYGAGKGNPQNYVPGLDGHRVAGWTNLNSNIIADGSIVSGAGGATNSAANKDAMAAMEECGQRSTFADNSTAAAAMASISYSKRVTIGDGYTGSELYKKVHDEVTSFPGHYYCSCDFAVATAVRWSGTDIEIPTNSASTVHNYLETSPKWEKVSNDAMSFSDIQPGDVCSSEGHVAMYIGEEIVQQVYDSTLKGTDADLGRPNSDQIWAQASNYNAGDDSHPQSRPPCLDEGVSANMAVYRCVKPDNSDEYSDIAIAGVTSTNSASIAACECVIVPDETEDPGDAIAELAVYMAATASPEERIAGITGDPWADNGDPRIDNLVTIVDATLGSWGGNDAYASCCQAACAVIAASADPDIAPSLWPENGSGSGLPSGPIPDDPWEEGMGGTAGPNATMWYCQARPDLYQKVGTDLSESELEPGDLLVSDTHVMIYVGNEAAKARFPETDANCYEAAYNDGVGGSKTCLYAGLTYRSDFSGFTVFRIDQINEDAAHDVLNWRGMVK